MSNFGYNVLGFGANASTSTGPSDDEFNRVSFKSSFEGANNGVNNVFDDGSASNHTITANGNVTQGSFGPFARPDGEFAVHFDGEGFYHCAADADFAFGTGDFCMEAWVFVEADAYNYSRVFNFGPYYNDNDSNGITVDHTDHSHKIRYYDYRNSFFLASSAATPRNEWFHVAVTKSSNTVRLFINGTAEASGTNSNAPEASGTNTVAIGNAPDAGTGQEDFQGFISNARVVKGSAVYTSDFTPSTSKLTAITNTKLLTCQSNRFVDNSAEAHAIIIGGAAGAIQVSAFGPFLTSAVYSAGTNGASVYMDGSGDSLSAASSADFALGTGDFTVEFWVYQKEIKDYTIYFDYRSTNSQATLYLYQAANGAFDLFISGTSHTFTPPSMLNRWAHIAISRSSSTTKLFVDGVQYLSFSDSTNYVQGTTFYVGRFWQSDTYNFNGYMCDFRWIKGTAVYTSAFTPPTAPLTAITNTKLSLNMADGQAIDSAAQNNLTLYGNANTSTDQAKFGTASLHLDGSGDYVNVLPSGRGNIYNYTVEQWLYPTRNYSGSGNFDRIWASGTALNNSVMLHLDNTTAPKIVLRSNDSIIWTSSVSISLNAWTHVAVSCDANGTRLYIAGTERATSSTVVNLRNLAFNIGTSTTSAGFFQGYIDDFRISDFARYTSNFTAPTEPFADKGQ